MTMSSSRPYMVRALYEWVVDNDCTPYVLVSAYSQGVQVPQQHVNEDGLVVLNVSPTAVSGLAMDEHALSFNARFGGVPTDIYVPYGSILRVYAKENGQGMVFEPEPESDHTPEPPAPSPGKRPSLKVIK